MFGWIESAFDRLSRVLVWFSGMLLFSAVMITCISIVGRGLTSAGLSAIPGDFELVEMLCGLSVFAFMSHCQIHQGHISVDIVLQSFGEKTMQLSQCLGDMVMTGLVAVLLWCHVQGFYSKLEYQETSFILQIPLWIPYGIAAILLFCFLLTSLFTVVKDIVMMLSKEEHQKAESNTADTESAKQEVAQRLRSARKAPLEKEAVS